MHFLTFSVFVCLTVLTCFNNVFYTSAAQDWELLDETLLSEDNKELLEVIHKYDNQTDDLVKVRLKREKNSFCNFIFYFVDWQRFG